MACVTTFMCHDDEDTALSRGLEGANFFGYSLAHYYVFGRHEPGRTDVWAEYQAQRAEHGLRPRRGAGGGDQQDRLGAKVVDEGIGGLRGAVGTPSRSASTSCGHPLAGAVSHVQTHHVEAGHDRPLEHLRALGRRADRGNDLRVPVIAAHALHGVVRTGQGKRNFRAAALLEHERASADDFRRQSADRGAGWLGATQNVRMKEATLLSVHADKADRIV